MLKAFQEELNFRMWQIRFCTPHNKEWNGDFVGNVYRSRELEQLGYLDSYEFYYCEPATLEIIRMIFTNQQELMKFLTSIGNSFRARCNLGDAMDLFRTRK